MPEEARMRIRRIVFRRARRLSCRSGPHTILCSSATAAHARCSRERSSAYLRNTISRSFTEMFLAIFQLARPENSFAKTKSFFVQVRPIHNLVRFRCSCTCKKLMQTFLCLLRNTISRSFTEMFLAIFQSTVPEKDAQIYEQQPPQRVLHAKLQHPATQCMARSPPAVFVGIASRNEIYMTQRNNKEY